MPRGDRTGPTGAGPMSGRGAGFCAGHQTAGHQTAGFQTAGGGFRRGCGRGFGFRNRFVQPELHALQQQIAQIGQQLEELKVRS